MSVPRQGLLHKLKELLTDSATYGLSTVAGQAINFLLLPLYTHFLSPEDYGVFAMLTIVSMVFGPLASMGMTNAIFRRFNLGADERDQSLWTGFTIVTGLAIGWTCVVAATADTIALHLVGTIDAAPLVRLTGVSAAASALGTVPLVVLRAERRVKLAAGINVAKVFITMVTSVWLVAVEQVGVLGIVMGRLAGEGTSALLLLGLFRRRMRFGFERATARSMLAYGVPFTPHSLQFVVLTVFGQYVVRRVLGLDEAGLYHIATKFTTPLSMATNAFNRAWVPYKFKVHAEDADPAAFFRSAVLFYLSGVGFVWVLLGAWGPELLRLTTPEHYHSAAPLIAVVGLIPVAAASRWMLATGFELGSDTRVLPLVTCAGLVMGAPAAFALVPALGGYGAAISHVVALATMTALLYPLAQKRLRVSHDVRSLALVLALAAVCGVVSFLASSTSAWTRISLQAAVSAGYPLGCYAILLFVSGEGARIRRISGRLKKRMLSR